MRVCLIGVLFIVNTCFAQKGWEAEVVPGFASYEGDLTQSSFSLHSIGPSAGANLKYNTGDFLNFRIGVSWGMVSGNDKYNSHADLRDRNLNFKTSILEGNICLELNLADPDVYYSYPYLFGGVGFFHFNPYTYDDNHKKVYLHPLSTEGEGLPEYPNVHPYSLNQVCIPFGAGWKTKIHETFTLSFEIGFRYLFTDYLDDVSGRYVDYETLKSERGLIAAEVADRQISAPAGVGAVRGNPNVKDMYAFGGIKLGFMLGRKE